MKRNPMMGMTALKASSSLPHVTSLHLHLAYFNLYKVLVASKGYYKIIYTTICMKRMTRLEGTIGKYAEWESLVA